MVDKIGYLFSVLKLNRKKTGNQVNFLADSSEQGKLLRVRKRLSGLSRSISIQE
jgi:DNA-directed RNA polymerase